MNKQTQYILPSTYAYCIFFSLNKIQDDNYENKVGPTKKKE